MKKIFENKHYFYLLLALIGGGYTYYFMWLGVAENKGNFDVVDFVKSTWIDNYYAKSLTLDFWTGAIGGTFFMLIEGIRLGMKRTWIYLFLTVGIAFAFGFPLFLFMRELHIKRNKSMQKNNS
jgi:hypothetical protein